MTTALALFTCFNRKGKSIHAIESLLSGNPGIDFTFLVVDDGSTDGTAEALKARDFPVRILRGDTDYDYLLMMNDDVDFYPGCIEAMAAQSGGRDVIVGATEDTAGKLSYSGIQYEKGIHYRFMDPGETEPAATMNANCVLIPYALFRKTGSMDPHYHHSLGDFDYGFALRKAGGTLRVSQNYVGLCCDNPQTGTWHDRSLPLKQRLKKKESIKGDPIGPWFYYLKKHFGLFTAIKSSLTPYIRIFLGL